MPLEQTILVECDVPAPMRDGTILRANVYRPRDGGPHPVLLTRLPYGKDWALGSLLDPLRMARAGYIVVVQDTRGRFTSEGEWESFAHEGRDGADTVAWAAALPGSTGQVGMYGVSYFGFTQWAAARESAPALRALFPLITWRNPLDGVGLRGGAFELGSGSNWPLMMGFDTAMRRHAGDPATLSRALYRLTMEMDGLARGETFRELPVMSFGPHERTGITRSKPEDLIHADVSGVPERTHAPALDVGGWYDIFLQGTLQNFMASQGPEATEEARRSRLLIGPWTHVEQGPRAGEVYFGLSAADYSLDLLGLGLRWFGMHLKGQPDPLADEPPVRIFVMGENVWRNEPAWPLARAMPTPYYLHSAGQAQSRHGDGTLSPSYPEAADASPDSFVYDPHDPVPTLGGAILMGGGYPAGPRDQRPIEDRPDMLCYTTAPLERDLEVTGPVHVTLWVTSSAPDTDFVARLVDVHPDGFAQNLTDGILRARYRHGMANPALLEPERPVELRIDLWATSNLFRAGHRMRLDITSSSFPRWDRNANTGADPATAVELHPAVQHILHDAEHPSHILLPVVPR